MDYVHTDKAPKAVGPYSQAIVFGDTIYCSGQIGLNPETGKLVEGTKLQTKQVLNNLQEVLKEAKSDKSKVLKTTIYLADINDYATVNEIYGEFFEDHKPARATVQVARLPLDCLVEIECIASRV